MEGRAAAITNENITLEYKGIKVTLAHLLEVVDELEQNKEVEWNIVHKRKEIEVI